MYAIRSYYGLNIPKSLVRGRLIQNAGEALISNLFAEKLGVVPGDVVTLIGSTMNGSMSMYNFTIVGTIAFGAEALDRGALIVDIEDARYALDMQNARITSYNVCYTKLLRG